MIHLLLLFVKLMAEKKFETSAWVLKSLDVENIEITKVNGNNCVVRKIKYSEILADNWA